MSKEKFLMKNSISRRSFLKAVGVLSAAGALAACGGSSSSSTAASSTAASAAASTAAGANIKLWTYPIGGWGKDETVQELISSFNAKYPDIKVTVEYLDYTNGDDQVNTAIEGGSAPDLIMEGPERLVANWGKKGVMAPLNDLWTDDAKKDIYASVESACRNEAGDYYEYPLCMTAHCMAVNMTKVKEVGADQYIDTDKHTWSTDGFLKTVDALYNGGYENVAAIYCSGQGGDQGTRAIINNMYGGTFTDAEHTKYTADSPENIKARSIHLLEMAGIANSEGVYKMYPHELSGGMRQRVMIAMALSCNPRLIIADEPTTALDVTIQAQILDLLRNLKDKINSSIMLITHDLGVIAEMADYVVVMYAGRVVEKGTAQEIFANPAHPYTIGLMASKPMVGKKVDKLYSIPGKVPNPINMPNYCYFKDRCEMCVEGCQGEYPHMIQLSPTHMVSCYRYYGKEDAQNG